MESFGLVFEIELPGTRTDKSPSSCDMNGSEELERVELFGFSLVERVDRLVEISRERDREERERRRS